MSLDDKLREAIWYELGDGLNATDVDEAVETIKNTFANEGYVQIPTVTKDEGGFVRVSPGNTYMTKEYWFKKYSPHTPSEELMTGAYWLDRFKREYEGIITVDDDQYLVTAIMTIAKRAAGIKND